jgi:lipid-binding SYLF domain-containing protein
MLTKVRMILALSCMITANAPAKEKADETSKRLSDATAVVSDAASMGIAKDLFEKSKCAIIIPNMKKGGFLLAAQYGKGFVSCKDKSSKFASLSAVKLEGGSFGLQAGGEGSDIVMLVMNDKGMSHLASSKFTLGGEASIAAGPVGRDTTAQTDATMNAEILSWSKSRGVFGGISLKGSTLRPDDDGNQNLYSKKVNAKAVHVDMTESAPAEGSAFRSALNQYVK